MDRRLRNAHQAAWVISATVLLGGCDGGVGGSSDFRSRGDLLSVQFPDPAQVNVEDEFTPPANAPLVQQIEMRFSAAPNPSDLSADRIQIRDSSGTLVTGTFAVTGTTVRFTPRLPLRVPVLIDQESGQYDNGGAGLEPGELYSLRINRSQWDFIDAIDPALLARFPDPVDASGIALAFSTTTDPQNFLKGVEPRVPRIVTTTPADGTVDLSPQLYGDPAGLFDDRAPFRLVFDGPILPALEVLDEFALIDVEDHSTDPLGLRLGVFTTLIENRPDRAILEVQPSGLLPFGHLLSLEIPAALPGLAQDLPANLDDALVIATYTVADVEEGDLLEDALRENFDTTDRKESDSLALDPGVFPADWDKLNSNVLIASFAFEGEGELGRFIPSAPGDETVRVILDTNRQTLPLFDGSTPDAPPGTEIIGGKFHFSDIDIPRNVILEVLGSNPLVLSATGSVRINGTIALKGDPGGDDNSFDSGVTSMPGGSGGAGGGRGGPGHPIFYFPPGSVSNRTLVSPPSGGPGFGHDNFTTVGGGGGESGILDRKDEAGNYGTNKEIACNEFGYDNDSFAAAGGSGTFLGEGEVGRKGLGNLRPDTQGGWLLTTKEDDRDNWDDLKPGARGRSVFSDSNSSNNFFGSRGELQVVVGGQGGGGGGSRTEAYYCGVDCKNDADPTNDERCMGGEFSGNFADSVGDARGGGGGGAGGALLVQALAVITLGPSCKVTASGGRGGGGEQLATSSWGGPGGGGSGGAIVIQSAERIEIQAGALLDVTGGSGKGPDGGHGIVQLQVPAGRDVYVPAGAIEPPKAHSDEDNELNPAPFSSLSAVISDWYDMGRAIARPPHPDGPPPVFTFRGTNAFGIVITDSEGNVIDPADVDIRCDYLGQEDPLRPGHYKDGQGPRTNFIPPNASVTVLFQGANAITPGSKEIDPSSVTSWDSRVANVTGMQFLRYQIQFDLAVGSATASPTSPRPAVQWIDIAADF